MQAEELKNKKLTRCHLLFLFYSLETQHVSGINMPISGVCDYIVELPHWQFCSWFAVYWSLGAVLLG